MNGAVIQNVKMDEKTRKFLEEHINKIVKAFSFENRSKNSGECPCYKEGKKCHDLPSLNCFFCYCPEYNSEIVEGGCKINSPKGKWFFDERLPKGKIWDCSDCDIPHNEETVRKYLRKLFGLK